MVIINFIKDCIDYLNQHSNLVIAVATCFTVYITRQIMNVNTNQNRIAEQKRKDDLFNTRCDCYQRIVKFINSLISSSDSPLYLNFNDPTIRSRYEYLIYPATVKSFKIEVEWLFDEELAIWLEEKLMNGYFSKYEHLNDFWFPTEEFTKKFDKYLKLK